MLSPSHMTEFRLHVIISACINNKELLLLLFTKAYSIRCSSSLSSAIEHSVSHLGCDIKCINFKLGERIRGGATKPTVPSYSIGHAFLC